jgi:hypothetical protein
MNPFAFSCGGARRDARILLENLKQVNEQIYTVQLAD